jgi:outer membrane protein assembly factor BamA
MVASVLAMLSVLLTQSVEGGEKKAHSSKDVVIRDVEFTGNTFVGAPLLATKIHSSRQWLHYCSMGKYDPAVAEADVRELTNFYRAFGFCDVRVNLETRRSPDGGEVTLNFHVLEGPRYRIAETPEVMGCSKGEREGFQTLLQVKKGDYASEAKVKDDARRIQEFCEARHHSVHVEPIACAKADGSGLLIVRYVVKEDEVSSGSTQEESEPSAVTIGRIHVRGNKLISRASILAHLPLKRGQVLNYADLRKAEETLAQLGLFVVDAQANVHPTIAVVDAESDSPIKDLIITVREK